MESLDIKSKERPTSPFLTIYRPQYTSMFSILQRASGIFLSIFFILYVLLIKLSKLSLSYYYAYILIDGILQGGNQIFIELVIILFILTNFMYHLCFGIRYLYWSYYGGESNVSVTDNKLLIMDLNKIYKANNYFMIMIMIAVIWFFIVFGCCYWQYGYTTIDILTVDNLPIDILYYLVLTPVLVVWLMVWFYWLKV